MSLRTWFLGCAVATGLLLSAACARRPAGNIHLLPYVIATISGRVVDARDGRPLADAIVELEGEGVETRSDSSGNFRVPALAAGRYVIRTRHVAFYPGRGELEVRSGTNYQIEIGLDVVMICLDACEGREPKPTPGFVRVTGVTPYQGPITVMSLMWCDSTPMKPVGRALRIPIAPTPAQGFGVLAGSVEEEETGDALASSGVSLVASAGGGGVSRNEQPADAHGGFIFESVVAGRYELRVRSIGHLAQKKAIHISANRMDTVRLALRTYRCHGY